MNAQHTPGPWHLCLHLKDASVDESCGCGYRGVIYGPEHDVAFAICQPGHDPAPSGQEGSEPARYPREVELANARLIASAPELLEALRGAREIIAEIDKYQKAPERGDYGVECACCMGELLDDDRTAIARIDAAIAKVTGAA